MIERIEALCRRLDDENLWGLDSDDAALEHARQLLPLMLEVAKAGDRAYDKSTREENGYLVSKREMRILMQALDELESYCAEHLPEVPR
jgi:trans-aconitate methyltransferase